jgi:hypothetical protein
MIVQTICPPNSEAFRRRTPRWGSRCGRKPTAFVWMHKTPINECRTPCGRITLGKGCRFREKSENKRIGRGILRPSSSVRTPVLSKRSSGYFEKEISNIERRHASRRLLHYCIGDRYLRFRRLAGSLWLQNVTKLGIHRLLICQCRILVWKGRECGQLVEGRLLGEASPRQRNGCGRGAKQLSTIK